MPPRPRAHPRKQATRTARTDLRRLQSATPPLPTSALQERELRYRSVFETAVEGIITMGEDRLIESMNPAALRMFGYTLPEVVGKNVTMLMPSPHREKHDGYVNAYLKNGRAKVIGVGRETSGIKKDGTIFPIALSVSEAQLPSKRLFTGVIRDLTERKHLEQEILRAADEERRRISQDLHDGVGSHLSGVAFLCDALSKDLEALNPPQARQARDILSLINQAVDQLRSVAHGLHPVERTRDGLMRALADLASQHQKAGIQCRFECANAVLLEDPAAANHLFRIAQEAITNALRHGRADQISIQLSQNSHQLTLRIADNGSGFQTEDGIEKKGLGLRTMAYRAGLFGGTLTVSPHGRRGAEVCCTLPSKRSS